MKLPKGVTIYTGGKKYIGEIPDHIASIFGYTEPVAAETKKKKSDKAKTDDGKSSGTN